MRGGEQGGERGREREEVVRRQGGRDRWGSHGGEGMGRLCRRDEGVRRGGRGWQVVVARRGGKGKERLTGKWDTATAPDALTTEHELVSPPTRSGRRRGPDSAVPSLSRTGSYTAYQARASHSPSTDVSTHPPTSCTDPKLTVQSPWDPPPLSSVAAPPDAIINPPSSSPSQQADP